MLLRRFLYFNNSGRVWNTRYDMLRNRRLQMDFSLVSIFIYYRIVYSWYSRFVHFYRKQIEQVLQMSIEKFVWAISTWNSLFWYKMQTHLQQICHKPCWHVFGHVFWRRYWTTKIFFSPKSLRVRYCFRTGWVQRAILWQKLHWHFKILHRPVQFYFLCVESNHGYYANNRSSQRKNCSFSQVFSCEFLQ